jgi:hypothetical protein
MERNLIQVSSVRSLSLISIFKIERANCLVIFLLPSSQVNAHFLESGHSPVAVNFLNWQQRRSHQQSLLAEVTLAGSDQ